MLVIGDPAHKQKWNAFTKMPPKLSLTVDTISIQGERRLTYCGPVMRHGVMVMMTSSNGNIFRVTGHLCGEFTGLRWIHRTKASDAGLWFFSLICALNKQLSKQSRSWWFETPSRSVWRHCNVLDHHCFRQWLVAVLASRHCLNQWRLVVNLILSNKVQWNFDKIQQFY